MDYTLPTTRIVIDVFVNEGISVRCSLFDRVCGLSTAHLGMAAEG